MCLRRITHVLELDLKVGNATKELRILIDAGWEPGVWHVRTECGLPFVVNSEISLDVLVHECGYLIAGFEDVIVIEDTTGFCIDLLASAQDLRVHCVVVPNSESGPGKGEEFTVGDETHLWW